MSLQLLLLVLSNKTTSLAYLITNIGYLIVFIINMSEAFIELRSIILIRQFINSQLHKGVAFAYLLYIFKHCFKCQFVQIIHSNKP